MRAHLVVTGFDARAHGCAQLVSGLLQVARLDRQPGQREVGQRHVRGRADAEDGLPGGPGLVGPALPLEALGQVTGRLGGVFGVPGGQGGPGGGPGPLDVAALLQHHGEAHGGLRPVGLARVGGEPAQDVGRGVEVTLLGQAAGGVEGRCLQL